MCALGSRNNGSVADQRVVNTRVRNQVGLELVEINVEGTVETKGGGDGGDNLGDEAVQVVVRRTGDIQVATADIVNSLVIDQESTVRVLDSAVGRQNSVVRLNDGGRDTRGRVHGELELCLLAILGGQTLEQEGTKTGTGATAERVEDQEALEGVAVVYDITSALIRLLSSIYSMLNSPATRRMRSMTLSTISLPMV